jgi:hypothetical protein
MSRDYDKVLELIQKQLQETRQQSAELRDIAKAARLAAERARTQGLMVRRLAQLVLEESRSNATKKPVDEQTQPLVAVKPRRKRSPTQSPPAPKGQGPSRK